MAGDEITSTCNKWLTFEHGSFYTASIYIGASIYAASEPGVMEEFGVSIAPAELRLALFALACMFPIWQSPKLL